MGREADRQEHGRFWPIPIGCPAVHGLLYMLLGVFYYLLYLGLSLAVIFLSDFMGVTLSSAYVSYVDGLLPKSIFGGILDESSAKPALAPVTVDQKKPAPLEASFCL